MITLTIGGTLLISACIILFIYKGIKERIPFLFFSGIFVLVMCIGTLCELLNRKQPEYTLDLINQDTVLIRNVETGREYTVCPERIVETLENDNS